MGRPWFRHRLTTFDTSTAEDFRPSLIFPTRTWRDRVAPFPTTFSTTVFSQCTCGRFEASPRRAAPEGQTTSIAPTAPHSAGPPSTNPSYLLRSRSQHLSHSTAYEDVFLHDSSFS